MKKMNSTPLTLVVAYALASMPSLLQAAPHGSTIPNDERFSTQWSFEQINDVDVDAVTAWEMAEAYPYPEPVTVAIIDAGIALKHRDLADRLLEGANFAEEGPPQNGHRDAHGTQIAGIIAARTNNEGPYYGGSVAGLSGHLPIRIMPIRIHAEEQEVILQGLADSFSVQRVLTEYVDAFNYAIDNGADVINFSIKVPYELPFLGGIPALNEVMDFPNKGCLDYHADAQGNSLKSDLTFEDCLKHAFHKAHEKGVLIVSATGQEHPANGGGQEIVESNSLSYYFPANQSFPNLIIVGSIMPDGSYDPTNHWGETVDVAAPGHNIESTVPNEADCLDFPKGGKIKNSDGITIPCAKVAKSGSSLAAPHVAAAAAIALSINPPALQEIDGISLSPAQRVERLKAAIVAGTVPIVDPPESGPYGYIKIPLILRDLGVTLWGEDVRNLPKAAFHVATPVQESIPHSEVYLYSIDHALILNRLPATEEESEFVQYEWNLGDDSRSLEENGSHYYNEAGTYEVSLTATSDGKVDHSPSLDVKVLSENVDRIEITYDDDLRPLTAKMIDGDIRIVRSALGHHRVTGSGRFLDENGNIFPVDLETNFPFFWVVSGHVSIQHPEHYLNTSFALLSPIRYSKTPETFSIVLGKVTVSFVNRDIVPIGA